VASAVKRAYNGQKMENALRYHAEIDLSQKHTSHAQLIRLVGRNKNVLEVGPATGYVTKILKARGCRVSCIEYDPEAARVAAEFCERMVVANIETIDFLREFRKERFGVVTFGDVLEHLVDPLGVLIRVKDVLKPGGSVVASVPNVAHGSVRLSLLAGRFDYREAGLLDRTHLRFFTEESLGKLFRDAGYEVRTWRRVLADPFVTEIELREEDYPVYLREAARSDLQAQTYQFVVKAYPTNATSNGRFAPPSAKEQSASLLGDLQRWQLVLAEKEAAIEQMNVALAERDAALTRREDSVQELTGQLASVQESLGYRVLESYRARMRRLFPAGSLQGVPYRSLASLAKRFFESRSKKTAGVKPPRSRGGQGEHSDGR
jgi:O-antigen biosynthesis protein